MTLDPPTVLDPEKVTQLVDKWRAKLGIGRHWSIGVKVIDDRSEAKKSIRDAFAYTEVEEAYFNADITFHGYRFEGKDERFLELVACHEVLHIVLHKVESLVEHALGDNESLAETLTENAVEILSRALVYGSVEPG